MMWLVEWLQNWGMFGITAVYAVLTLLIFITNCFSNKHLTEQIEESKKQHEENKHLEILPYFKIDCIAVPAYIHPNFDIKIFYPNKDVGDKEESGFKVTLENIGLGPAIDIQYLWGLKNEWGQYLAKGTALILPNALTVNEMRDIIYHVQLPHVSDLTKEGINQLSLESGFIYHDLLSARYKQNVVIDLEMNTNSPDVIIKRCYVEKQKKLETSPEQNL